MHSSVCLKIEEHSERQRQGEKETELDLKHERLTAPAYMSNSFHTYETKHTFQYNVRFSIVQ